MRWPYSQKSFLGSPLDVCQISGFYRQRHDSLKNIPLSAALRGVLCRMLGTIEGQFETDPQLTEEQVQADAGSCFGVCRCLRPGTELGSTNLH